MTCAVPTEGLFLRHRLDHHPFRVGTGICPCPPYDPRHVVGLYLRTFCEGMHKRVTRAARDKRTDRLSLDEGYNWSVALDEPGGSPRVHPPPERRSQARHCWEREITPAV